MTGMNSQHKTETHFDFMFFAIYIYIYTYSKSLPDSVFMLDALISDLHA